MKVIPLECTTVFKSNKGVAELKLNNYKDKLKQNKGLCFDINFHCIDPYEQRAVANFKIKAFETQTLKEHNNFKLICS